MRVVDDLGFKVFQLRLVVGFDEGGVKLGLDIHVRESLLIY